MYRLFPDNSWQFPAMAGLLILATSTQVALLFLAWRDGNARADLLRDMVRSNGEVVHDNSAEHAKTRHELETNRGIMLKVLADVNLLLGKHIDDARGE